MAAMETEEAAEAMAYDAVMPEALVVLVEVLTDPFKGSRSLWLAPKPVRARTRLHGFVTSPRRPAAGSSRPGKAADDRVRA
jgi:hypothetical protein